eukprot:195236_1
MAEENKQHPIAFPNKVSVPIDTQPMDRDGEGNESSLPLRSMYCAYFNRVIPSKQIHCTLCKQPCYASSYLSLACQSECYFCYFCLTNYLQQHNHECPIELHHHTIEFAKYVHFLEITSCQYEGCKWIGPSSHLTYHKDNECEYCIEYLRQKCKSLQQMVNAMNAERMRMYKQVWYHPGKVSMNEDSKVHFGPKLWQNVWKTMRKHIWVERHCGQQINAGFYNGIPLIQWNCCDNKWDDNTANGCAKVCSECGIKYGGSKASIGCIEEKEMVKYVTWSCCDLTEEMSSFKSKGCMYVYECCNRAQNDKGCQFVWSLQS